jgi:hypothetical protein
MSRYASPALTPFSLPAGWQIQNMIQLLLAETSIKTPERKLHEN